MGEWADYSYGEDDMTASNDTDHTSGVMRCQWRVLGGHIHCKVFGPYSGKAGDLVFRVEEWDHFRRIHSHWSFREDTPHGQREPDDSDIEEGSEFDGPVVIR